MWLWLKGDAARRINIPPPSGPARSLDLALAHEASSSARRRRDLAHAASLFGRPPASAAPACAASTSLPIASRSTGAGLNSTSKPASLYLATPLARRISSRRDVRPNSGERFLRSSATSTLRKWPDHVDLR